jgi:hypothetical protein
MSRLTHGSSRPTANDGVDCMHGPSECMGNIIELCARELYPDPKINLGFIMCLSRDYQDIPGRSLVEDCALESAIDFQQLNDCAVKEDGAYGLSLLRNSIKRTADVCRNRLTSKNVGILTVTRPVLPRVPPFVSTAKFIASAMVASGPTAPTALA